MNRLADLRCDGVRRTGTGAGHLKCGYLLCRIGTLQGVMETKCPRCNTVRVWTFTGALVGRATT